MTHWKGKELIERKLWVCNRCCGQSWRKRSLLLHRPVQRLYPLEVQDTKTVNRDVKPEGKTVVKAEEIDSKPPRRRAAMVADEKRKLIDKFTIEIYQGSVRN